MGKIITLGREFGSGGRELGRKLAEELGYAYYDRQIVEEIAKHTSLTPDYVDQLVAGKGTKFSSMTIGRSFFMMNEYHVQQMQEVFQAQKRIIEKIGKADNCVIIGRCADYILREKSPVRIFVCAELEKRIDRCMKHKSVDENMSENDMKKKILSIDKSRAKYYHDFTGLNWGEMVNYDICVNTTNLEIDKIVSDLAYMFR